MITKYVAYYRVSTKMQANLNNQSSDRGLGLQSQKDQVTRYVANNNGIIIDSFLEVETGTSKKERIEIHKAIALALKEKAILIVAKLDRLSRNVKFTQLLYESKVNFICTDNPSANKLTINILCVIAQNEAEQISKRVKDALAMKKINIANGNYVNKNGSHMVPINGVYRLGATKPFNDEMREKAKIVRLNNAINSVPNKQATQLIVMYRDDKHLAYQKIADKLNDSLYKTRFGKSYRASSVRNLYLRSKETNS